MMSRNLREDMTNVEKLKGLMLPSVKDVIIKVIVVPFVSTRSLKEMPSSESRLVTASDR